MTSTSASTEQSHPPSAVRRAAVVTHGKPQAIGSALARLANVARESGVELQLAAGESEKHGLEPGRDDADVDIAVVLGGDGTMLRGLTRFLGTGVPVLGVNFGRVGFLTAIQRDEIETGLARVFAGEYTVIELPTLDVEVGDEQREWAVGGAPLGRIGCDGIVCSTPSGSTGYNLSNGGPVLVWGIDAMAITFVAPHALHARPLVVARGAELIVWNRTPDVPATALVDGHPVGDLAPGGRAVARLGEQRSLLATLPEVTFFSRYSRTFAS